MSRRRSEDLASAQKWTRRNLADRSSELLANLESEMTVLRGGSDEVRRLADELQTIVDEVRQALEKASASHA